MVPRGLKGLLKKTARAKFVASRQHGGGYRMLDEKSRKATGARLRGVAKRISETLCSDGQLPKPPSDGVDKKGKAWRGEGGSLRRGTAVDRQVSRLCKVSERQRQHSAMLTLTRMVFVALEHHNMVPVDAQRVVCDASRRLGTAVDIVAMRGARLVLVELKCGFHGRKDLPARDANGKLCMLKAPLTKAKDCVLHRHFAQLAATLALFKSEKTTQQQLQKIGIADVDAVLLYVDDGGSILYELPEWWQERGHRILNNICQN